MRHGIPVCLSLVLGLGVQGISHAAVSFEFIGEGFATDVSADGSVITGNLNSTYGAFRWTAQEGIVPLGQDSTYLGVGAGSPDISDDGTKISATILSADSTYVTAGIWTQGQGWQELIPPMPPGGSPLGVEYASGWGLSGDGLTGVGLFWRNGQPDGTAHGFAWTSGTNAVDLGSDGRDSRANDANFDGSVIVGWDSNPDWGGWRPTVWVDGVKTVLENPDAFAEASAVSPDGTIIVGQSADGTVRQAAVWRRNELTMMWDKELLGTLFGTHPDQGLAMGNDLTPDGSTIVGFNSFSFGSSTGFIWTAERGMIDVEQYLLENGVTLDPQFVIQSLTGISDDGTVIVGGGRMTVFPFNTRGFIIRTNAVAAEPTVSARPSLGQNYPNPFNPITTIPVQMAADGNARLEIVDLKGRRIRLLHSDVLPAGTHEFRWDGTDELGTAVSSGVYLAQLRAGAAVIESRRMLLLK